MYPIVDTFSCQFYRVHFTSDHYSLFFKSFSNASTGNGLLK